MAESWNGLHTEKDFQLLEGTSFVQVYVGPEAQCWVLQMDLVCHLSSFFKAALRGGFKEADEKRVTLEEDDPNVFRIFLAWLYAGEIRLPKVWDGCMEMAWILGDRLGAPAFQDCAMTKFITCADEYSNLPQIVEDVYGSTTKGSLLRAAVVDSIAFYISDIEEPEADWNPLFARGGAFVVDLLGRFVKWDDIKDPALVLDKYLLKTRAQLPPDVPPQAGNTLVEGSGARPTRRPLKS